MNRPSTPGANRLALNTGATIHGVPVTGMVLVGRAQTCTLVLDSSHVSRMHAQFWIEHDAMWVEDLGSRNGVLVNGRKILERTRLDVGDRVLIGDRTLEVTVRSSDRNPTIPVMSSPEGAGHVGIPPAPPSPSATAQLRSDDTMPTALETSSPLRSFLDSASASLAGGNLLDAADAMRHFCETVDETAHIGGTDRSALDGATKVMLLLAETTTDVSWVERLLAARHRMAYPLDEAATERVADLIVALPFGPDPQRRAYVSWMKSQQLRPPQKEAVKRLSDARAKNRPPR